MKVSIYWRCQLLGWSGFFLFQTGLGWLMGQMDAMFPYLIITNILGLACSHLLRWVIHRFQLKSMPIKRLVWFILAILPLPVLTLTGLSFLTAFLLGKEAFRQALLEMFLQISLNWALVFASWLTIYFAVTFFKRYQQTEIEKWKMKAYLHDAELQALRTQINPHFMFNCLTSACALTVEDPPKARTVLTQLSDLMRYSLTAGEHQIVALEQDLAIVEKYLALETTRLEDRLHHRIDVPEACRQWRIPTMTLQILAENGIKHGIANLSEGGELTIEAGIDNGALRLRVGNNGTLHGQSKPGHGLGLANIAERLNLLYKGKASFSLEQVRKDWVQAELRLPEAPAT